MSKLLRKVSDFLKLLLETSKEQAKALFYTITPAQTSAICEILFNIQKLPLNRRVTKELQKRKHLLKKLGSTAASVRSKLALI